MNIQQVSSGASDGHNEDLVAVLEHDGCVDIIVMDGATSVADRNYIDDAAGDVVWFVRQFGAALAQVACKEIDQPQTVLLVLEQVKARFDELTSASAIPLYAHPIAAMTWIRITDTGEGATLDLYCVGDCKAVLLSPGQGVLDLDPWINPQESILRAEIDRLAAEGVLDAAARRERLLPMLRARREEQNTANPPAGLCLQPSGPLAARRYTVQAAPGSMLLAMTDGFSRIFDTYDMCSINELARRCLQGELQVLLAELRAFEAGQSAAASTTVKRSDDASAVAWVCAPLKPAHG
jgi:uncharacterized small protein (DUF1192 family)